MSVTPSLRLPAVVSLAAALVAAALVPATAEVPAEASLDVPVLVHEGDSWTIHDGADVIALPESITDNGGTSLPGPGQFKLLSADAATSYVVSEFTVELDEDGSETIEGDTRFELHLVSSDGSATTFHDDHGEADGAWARSSHDGSRVFVSTPIDDFPFARVVEVDGTVTTLPEFGSEQVLDFVGAKVMHAVHVRSKRFTGDQLVVTNLNRNTSRVRFRVANQGITAASLSHGLVAWREPRGKLAPLRTSVAKLSKPKKTLWTKKFGAVAFNPTGKRVIGWGPKGRLQVRRVSNGKMVTKLPKGLLVEELVWGDRRTVVIAGAGTVTRCGMDGSCTELLHVDGEVDVAEVLVNR